MGDGKFPKCTRDMEYSPKWDIPPSFLVHGTWDIPQKVKRVKTGLKGKNRIKLVKLGSEGLHIGSKVSKRHQKGQNGVILGPIESFWVKKGHFR